jgi:hypothetical protein
VGIAVRWILTLVPTGSRAPSETGNRSGEVGGGGRERTLSNHRTANQTRSNFGVWPSGRAAEHNKLLKGLILAQNERWRPGLGMQVERTQQWGAA